MKYEIINETQGSDSWLEARKSCFTASEAPSAKGKGKYQTRDELLAQKKTGLVKEVDAHTQKLFRKGHDTEAMARVLAEEMIGEELYPITAKRFVDGLPLLASMDGLTMDGRVGFEHKLLSQSLIEQIENNTLEEHYTIQMDQQILVTDCEKILFVASDGTKENFHSMWYESTPKKQDSLIVAWTQFEKDLESYVPPVQVEKVVAETTETLPVPSVVVSGSITKSNLAEITPLFDNYLASVNTTLKTDQDFADAEANAKNCRETAKRIKSLRENIIAQMADVNAVDCALDNYETAFNKVGLALEKAVKEQKETLKSNAILTAKNTFIAYVQSLENDFPFSLQMPMQSMGMYPDFAGAIKGVKTIESMQSRINDALANGKAQATTLANDVKTKLAYIDQAGKGYEHLIVKHDLAFKDIDFIKLSIKSTIDQENARRAEYEAEATAKAEAEALAKFKVETEKLVIEESAVVTNNTIVGNSAIGPIESNLYDTIDPSPAEIVQAVSVWFKVDKVRAHKILLDADFYKMAKVD